MAHSFYHRILRVSLLTTALVLVFDSGLLSPITKQLSDNTMNYLANSVGVFAQIEPNELNTMTAELTARERDLDAREARVRDIESRTFGESGARDNSTYILSIILFILTILISFNYFLDWRRAQIISSV